MRVHLLVLFTSCALLVASASDASNVRGNSIASHDKLAAAQSVAKSQQGIPVKRLLRTIDDEERGINNSGLASWMDKNIRFANKLRKLPPDEALDLFLTKMKKETPDPTVFDIFKSKRIPALVKAFNGREKDLFEALSTRFNTKSDVASALDRNLALALHELKKSGKVDKDDVEKLIQHHFINLQHPVKRQSMVDVAFKVLMASHDSKVSFTMSVEAIDALEGYIKQTMHANPTEHEVLGKLFATLEHGAGSEAEVISTIASRRTEEGAQLLEEKLYTYFSHSKQDKVVEKLFSYGKMQDLGMLLLKSKELDMLERFYVKSTGLNIPLSVTTKVKALRKGFGDDAKVESLLSKAKKEGTEEIQLVAKEMETEFWRQVKPTDTE